MTPKEKKRLAAQRAIDFIKPGMVLGLGTGSTASECIQIIGQRVKEGLDIIGIPTSNSTRRQCEELDVPITTLDVHPFPSLAIDGADELDSQLRLIKGGGGALLREKIIASAADYMIAIVDDSKKVEVLGAYPLPIEILPFGLETTIRLIESLSINLNLTVSTSVRKTASGQIFRTDNDNVIVDCNFSQIANPEALAKMLNSIPGIIEHGLFIGIADIAIVAGDQDVEILKIKK
ncbi:MAG: ribose-5-phosphate isomerase RpiA [Hyphomicrobiaceae bacterium]|nr:ribose-5-phosphate isomerase RpiA [Hyphomicrobiaceae bacterium]